MQPFMIIISTFHPKNEHRQKSMTIDIAGQLISLEYCNAKLKGRPTLRKTSHSLFCFDQTLPVRGDIRAGRHELCKLSQAELPYYSASGAYRYRVPKKLPSDFTRKGDGIRIKSGEMHKEVQKTEPPLAGAFLPRDNPPNTLFRKLYERGDLPLQIMHTSLKNALNWKVDIRNLEYHYYLPIFFDGIREKEDPYRFIAVKGVEDLLKEGKGKILPVISQLIIPIKTALNTRDPFVISIMLQVMCKLVESDDMVGQSLVPYYRQLLPILNIYKNNIPSIGDNIDYAQQKNICLGELVNKTLELFELHGGENAFINIKYMVPTYESCARVD